MNFVYRILSADGKYTYREYINLISQEIKKINIIFRLSGYSNDKILGRFLGINNYFHINLGQSQFEFFDTYTMVNMNEYLLTNQELMNLTFLTEETNLKSQFGDKLVGYNEAPFNIQLILDPIDVLSRYIQYIDNNPALFTSDLNNIIAMKKFYFAYFNDLTMYQDQNDLVLRKKYNYDRLYLESILMKNQVFLDIDSQFLRFNKIDLINPVINTDIIEKF